MVSSFSARTRGVGARDVREIDEFLEVLVDRLEPDAVPAFEAQDLWAAFDAIERRASAAKTLLARRVEDACAWKRNGFRSAAEQLAAMSGTSIRTAKNELETSKQVRTLPEIAAALRAGRLSGGEGAPDRRDGAEAPRCRNGTVGRRGGGARAVTRCVYRGAGPGRGSRRADEASAS